jgi:hypothetical protein
MVSIGDTFTPGQTVQVSGIYDVLHDPAHTQRHQVTCVYGEPFPPCRTCKHGVRYRLAVAAIHVTSHDDLKRS